MTALSFTSSFRLALWREVHARAGLLLLMLGLLVVEVLLPEAAKEPWEPFVLLLLLPPIAVALALRGPASTDRFWRGLGGPGAAW